MEGEVAVHTVGDTIKIENAKLCDTIYSWLTTT